MDQAGDERDLLTELLYGASNSVTTCLYQNIVYRAALLATLWHSAISHWFTITAVVVC
jgi:hypothetical protein